MLHCARYNCGVCGYFEFKNYRDERVKLLSSVFNVRLFLDIMFHCSIFKNQKLPRGESKFNYNVRLFLDIIFHFFDFLKQKLLREESNYLLSSFTFASLLEVVFSYNFRYLRYFKIKNCESESIFRRALLDIKVGIVDFLNSKDTGVRVY